MSVILPYSFRIPIPTLMGTLSLTKDSRFPSIEFNSNFDSGIPFKNKGSEKRVQNKHQENQSVISFHPIQNRPPKKIERVRALPKLRLSRSVIKLSLLGSRSWNPWRNPWTCSRICWETHTFEDIRSHTCYLSKESVT